MLSSQYKISESQHRSNSQFGDQKGCGVCLARMSAAGSCRQAPWMGLRRSSTGIPHTLKSAKLLKLGIAGNTDTNFPTLKFVL
ncbi:hypothetical protein EQU24_01555 [Methylotuvimicrobium buryatense]|uniref:Uncharacterized protein n=1 Tax=Methylotuvimicrobium buryatense TaxID=95641 RepID=A0A4P9USZ6_METBY|nr:hypothetical protein EQU24_01555 [Methylotuvimicrobium buryatense]